MAANFVFPNADGSRIRWITEKGKGLTYGPEGGPSLSPDRVAERIQHGDAMNKLGKKDQVDQFAQQHDIPITDVGDYRAIARTFGQDTPFFGIEEVTHTPWAVLELLSVKKRPLEIRRMVGWLVCSYVNHRNDRVNTRPYDIKPNLPFLKKIMARSEDPIIVNAIKVMYAHYKKEQGESMTTEEQVYLRQAVPDLANLIEAPYTPINDEYIDQVDTEKDDALVNDITVSQTEIPVIQAPQKTADDPIAALALQITQTLQAAASQQSSAKDSVIQQKDAEIRRLRVIIEKNAAEYDELWTRYTAILARTDHHLAAIEVMREELEETKQLGVRTSFIKNTDPS